MSDIEDRTRAKITLQYGSTTRRDSQLQDIADRTLRKIALEYGSTTRRDFRVIEIVMAEMIGSASVVAGEASGIVGQERSAKDTLAQSALPQTVEEAKILDQIAKGQRGGTFTGAEIRALKAGADALRSAVCLSHQGGGERQDDTRSGQPQLRAGEADPRDDLGTGSGVGKTLPLVKSTLSVEIVLDCDYA